MALSKTKRVTTYDAIFAEVMQEYALTGRIGMTQPKNKEHARKIASVLAGNHTADHPPKHQQNGGNQNELLQPGH